MSPGDFLRMKILESETTNGTQPSAGGASMGRWFLSMLENHLSKERKADTSTQPGPSPTLASLRNE